MSDFRNTSDWKKKDGTTLVYSYTHSGKSHEGESEKEPKTLGMQLERLSFMGETSWRFEDEKDPNSKTGYFTREYITALGVLDCARIHTITLDESANNVFSRLDISIYPVDSETLKKASTFDEWRIFDNEEKPEDGWLEDELGRIDYHGMSDYFDRSLLSARLFLDREKFDELAQDIKAGGIQTACVQLFADLYQFGWEGVTPFIRGSIFNYAILCEEDGNGTRGNTKARLQEVLLEWAPTLAQKTAAARDEPDQDELLEPNTEPVERDVGKVVTRLARDIRAIRGKVDIFYQVLIAVFIFWGLSRVLNWLGF